VSRRINKIALSAKKNSTDGVRFILTEAVVDMVAKFRLRALVSGRHIRANWQTSTTEFQPHRITDLDFKLEPLIKHELYNI
jgi:hypothetical protein